MTEGHSTERTYRRTKKTSGKTKRGKNPREKDQQRKDLAPFTNDLCEIQTTDLFCIRRVSYKKTTLAYQARLQYRSAWTTQQVLLDQCCYSMCGPYLISIRLTVCRPYFCRTDVCLTRYSFRSNVVLAKCPLILVFVGHLSFDHLSFGILSFRLNVFRLYVFWSIVFSVLCLSVICPFHHLSLGYMFRHRKYHFRKTGEIFF